MTVVAKSRRPGRLHPLWSASFAVLMLAGPFGGAQDQADVVTDVADLRERPDEGDVEAQYALAMKYRDGDVVDQYYAEAMRLLRLAANQDESASGSARIVALARLEIGNLYFTGEGVPADYGESAKWFQLATEIGAEDASDVATVANLNFQQATRSFARRGDRNAQATLGTWYANGEGVPQDYAAALLAGTGCEARKPIGRGRVGEALPEKPRDGRHSTRR